MVLSHKHRSALFDFLVPHVGDDAAEALMAEFPTTEGDHLVTRDHLRAELADLRADLSHLRVDLVFRVTGTMLGALALATTIILAVD